MGASKRVAEMFCQNVRRKSAPTRFDHRALRQRARFGRQRGAAVPRADSQRRPGDGHASGDHALLHDDSRGLPADPAGRRDRRAAAKCSRSTWASRCRSADLAEQMIRLAGKIPGRDIAIVYTGLRPGEKLFENCSMPQESYGRRAHAKILLAAAAQHRRGDMIVTRSSRRPRRRARLRSRNAGGACCATRCPNSHRRAATKRRIARRCVRPHQEVCTSA